jgi:L-threonylcarbamoyladenylate synthase
MKKIYLNIHKANSFNLRKAKKYIENNNIIGLPTETVYGLAGNAYSNISVKKIYNLKKRPNYNPLIVHYHGLDSLKNDVILNKNFMKLYKVLCPGPITFILKKRKKSNISKFVNGGKNTLAVRFPKHKIARKLLKLLKTPLAAPSANMSSKISPTSAEDVIDEFKSKIKLVLDGGRCKVGLESTIIDLAKKASILRQGSITKKKIQQILKINIKDNNLSKVIRAPGQLKLHYSPGIPIFMNKQKPKANEAFITYGKKYKNGKNRFNLSKNNNLNEAANNLYRIMRKIKKKKYKSIIVAKIPKIGIGLAINDRLKKASYK